MRRRRGGRVPVAATLATAGLLAAGGAYATAGDRARPISACVHHRGGGLYQAKTCAKHDRKLTWDAVGPRGLSGAAGRNGTNGTNGTNGANGIGASSAPVDLQVGAGDQQLAALGSTASVYGLCNDTSSEILFLLGVDAAGPLQVLGSYSEFTLTGAPAGTAPTNYPTTGDPANHTEAIATRGNAAPVTFLEDVVAKTSAGLFSGGVIVTLGSGSVTTHYQVHFDVETLAGSPDSCQGDVLVYPA